MKIQVEHFGEVKTKEEKEILMGTVLVIFVFIVFFAEGISIIRNFGKNIAPVNNQSQADQSTPDINNAY